MDDSESETDLFPNNVLSFQNQGTTICAKGPNINSTTISSLSFRNNNMTSTMNAPWNLERPRYSESVYNQRSMNYGREPEMSPMSLHSASGMLPRNIHQSYYPVGMSSSRSMYNGRSGSPTMSVRTIDSNTSVTARDIAFAFQTGNFNKFEFQIIKDAYNKFLKGRVRKRVEKRRNIRMFLKGFRRRSGGDSGDQASDSSISSDDRMSSRTSKSTIYKGSLSSCRSTKTSISDFKRNLTDKNIIRDCTTDFRQTSFKNRFPVGPASLSDMSKSKLQNATSVPQKDRFRSGFLLPSQRFNKSFASIPENSERLQKFNKQSVIDRTQTQLLIVQNQNNQSTQRRPPGSDSEHEEIFGEVTLMEKVSHNGKRGLDEDNSYVSENKRLKPCSSQTSLNTCSPKVMQTNTTLRQKSNDFVFAKPQFPLKKNVIKKQQKSISKSREPMPLPAKKLCPKPLESTASTDITNPNSTEQPVEILLAKSAPPVETISKPDSIKVPPVTISRQKELLSPSEITQLSTTNMSMRPSFIKRKLYTQKLDNTEKNSSSDSIQADSPQTNIYSKIQKEKNKARKLVTTQSCLSRDVADDSNLLDLIQKVVPLDRMNLTAKSKSEGQNKSKPNAAEKFDVTSVISNCNNNEDVSDTFTDEEIFTADDSNKQKQEKSYQKGNNEKQVTVSTKQNNLHQTKANSNKVKLATDNNHLNEKQKSGNDKNKLSEKQKDNDIRPVTANNQIKVQKETQCKRAKNIKEQKQVNSNQKDVCNKIDEGTDKRENSLIYKGSPKVRIEKIPSSYIVSPTERNGLIKTDVYKCVKSFWDTDIESDFEATPHKNANTKLTGILMKKLVPVNELGGADILSTRTVVEPILKTTTNKENIRKEDSYTNPEVGKVVSNNTEIKKAPISQKENIPPIAPPKSVDTKDDNCKIQKTAWKTKSNNINLKSKDIDSNKIYITKENHKTIKPKDVILKTKQKTKKSSKKEKQSNNTVTNESIQLKAHDNTLRIRPQRQAKINGCCECDKEEKPEKTLNESSLYKTLRSRQVDLSTSIKSDDNSMSIKTATNKKGKPQKQSRNETNKSKGDKTSPNDISFNINKTKRSPANKQSIKKTSRNTKNKTAEKKTRQSDVSFTLNNTISTRSSRINKEVESLRVSSTSFFNSGKKTLSDLTLNTSRYASRLNRSRQITKSRS